MDEVWKDIYFVENGIEWDYRGLYQVSNKGGRVKSLKYGKEKILKAGNIGGYEIVNLCKNSKQKSFYIHRLVAHMFLTGYFEGAEVNHKDENKTNNHVENLEWCDSKYNNNYGTRNERASKSMKGENNPRVVLVARFDLNMNLIDVKYHFEYKVMGFNAGNICSCCKGRYKQHKGFIFRYLSDVPDDVINSYIIRTKQIPIDK